LNSRQTNSMHDIELENETKASISVVRIIFLNCNLTLHKLFVSLPTGRNVFQLFLLTLSIVDYRVQVLESFSSSYFLRWASNFGNKKSQEIVRVLFLAQATAAL
jgi:hypothetical protein